MSESSPNLAYLVRVAGPALPQLILDPARSPLTLGRHDSCALQTAADEERISRYHARFTFESGRWLVTDLKSTWGTYLNGYRLPPNHPHILSEGDLIRVTPWTLSFRASPVRASSIASVDDLKLTLTSIRSIAPSAPSIASDPISLLIEATAGIHQASDESTLAQFVIDMARRGTGYTNAAWLRPSDTEGGIEVIASTNPPDSATYSRSLLHAASTGQLALLEPTAGPISQSIISLNIQRGLCVPLMLGQTIAAYLYLDSRDLRADHRIHPRAEDFTLALARIASLSLANMKRIEIEHRQASLDAEMQQAAAIQKFILPQRLHAFGPLSIIGESRPGQFVGGDFFDIIPLDDHRIALVLGDVSGKGVAASVIMTTIHGFLHAILETGVELADAVQRLNAFLEPRRPDERFATLFAAVIDTQNRTLTYVDAAHGYGILWDGATLTPLQAAGGPPLGVFTQQPYTCATIPFTPGQALLTVSDGIIEQPTAGEPRRQFEIEGVLQTLQNLKANQDPVAALFSAVESHAATPHLADDATILLARW